MRRLAIFLLSLALASPALAHNTWPYPNGRCPAASSCVIGSTSTTSIMFTTDGTNLDLGSESNVLTLITTGGGTATFRGADAGGPANTTYDTTGAGTITVGSADVSTIVASSATVGLDLGVNARTASFDNAGSSGSITIDLRDYADTTDDDMAHGIISTNCTTTGTGVEECDMNISITTGGANVEVLAMDPAGAIEIGDPTTTTFNLITDSGTVVVDGAIFAPLPIVVLASGALLDNRVHLATASGADYDIAATACDAASDLGTWITVIVEDASSTISITVDDTDNQFIVPLLSLAPDEELDSVADANGEGTHITLTCMAVDKWYATSMSYLGVGSMALAWANGGAAD